MTTVNTFDLRSISLAPSVSCWVNVTAWCDECPSNAPDAIPAVKADGNGGTLKVHGVPNGRHSASLNLPDMLRCLPTSGIIEAVSRDAANTLRELGLKFDPADPQVVADPRVRMQKRGTKGYISIVGEDGPALLAGLHEHFGENSRVVVEHRVPNDSEQS